jgi:predicted permease
MPASHMFRLALTSREIIRAVPRVTIYYRALRSCKSLAAAWLASLSGGATMRFSFPVTRPVLQYLTACARDALRGLRADRPAVSLAFLLLALTMTAGTVVFSVVDAIAIRPLPYAAPNQLVSLRLPSRTAGAILPASFRDYVDWRDDTQAFEAVAASRPRQLTLERNGTVQTIRAREVTANLFDVLGVRPALGRTFGLSDARPGRSDVVVLSDDLWTRRFARDPAVIGRSFELGGVAREVIGVLPADVQYPIRPSPAEMFFPHVETAADRSDGRCCVLVVARLRDGVTLEQARAEVQATSSAVVLALQDEVVGPAKAPLLLVLAAVGLVLLVACVNVASLFLARATMRAPEFATREALGASRARLVATQLFEGLLVALAASVAALALSHYGVRFAAAALPPGLTRVSTIAVNARVLAASVGSAAVCSLVFSIAPAWLASRRNLVSVLKTGSLTSIGPRRSQAFGAFLAVDVAFVCALVLAALLVVTTFVRITTADLGFDRENVVYFPYQRSFASVPVSNQPAAIAAFRTELLQRAKSVPGVAAAALSNSGVPLGGSRVSVSLTVPGRGEIFTHDLDSRTVTPEFFDVLGVRLLRGRLLQSSDRAGSPPVMVINDVAARRFFGDRDALGQVVGYSAGPTTIVGVVKGMRVEGPEADVPPQVYSSLDQKPYYAFTARDPVAETLIVRTTTEPRGLADAIARAIRPALGMAEAPQPHYVDDNFSRLTAGRRFNAELVGIFGLIALVIAALGIYGTTTFMVSREVRAIGIRMALGAPPSAILRSVLARMSRWVALGVLCGLTGAWMISGAFRAFVFGITPTNPILYVATAVVIVSVAIAAALPPALRAARIDPLVALRDQ